MKWLHGKFFKPSEVRIILVLTARGVGWYRCENSQISDYYQHSLHDDPLDVVKVCPWLKNHFASPEAGVELIVDTVINDLDRVKLLDSEHGFSRCWNIRKVLWNLRREYADATVNKLPKTFYPDIASVLHSQLDADSSAWLKRLDECAVVVTHVASSNQVLCDAFRQFPNPVLLYVFDGVDRHRVLLITHGLPLHMRQVVNTDNVEKQFPTFEAPLSDIRELEPYVSEGNIRFAEKYLQETLNYLSQSVFSTLEDILVVFPRELANAESTKPSDEYLVRHLAGAPSDVNHLDVSLSNGSKKNFRLPNALSAIPKNLSIDILTKRASGKKKTHVIGMSEIPKANRYEVTRCAGNLAHLLAHSITTVKGHRRSLIFRRCTYVITLAFILTLLIASSFGLIRANEDIRLQHEHASLAANLNKLNSHATTLHSSPSFVMDSTIRLQHFDDSLIPTPAHIMSRVSEAVQAYPSVSLTGFVWTNSADNSESNYVAVNSVSIRDSYWDDDSSSTQTFVEMSGQFLVESSLRQKQAQLDSFLKAIAKSANVGNLAVVESPATSASSSRTMLEPGNDFKIRFSIKPI